MHVKGYCDKEKDWYVVPTNLKNKVLKGIHDEAGHQGQKRTLYWTALAKDAKDYVQRCRHCLVSKSPEPEARAPLENVKTSRPLELVCIDFWSAEDSSNKFLDVLVVTDHFTKLAQAYLCPNQSAKAVAHQLNNNNTTISCVFMGFYGIAEMLQVAAVEKSHTTPYHPMGNETVKKFYRTLGNMIRALPPRAKHKWPQFLRSLTLSYNATVHETTGFVPFLLMFGRIPRLPVDMRFQSVLMDEQVVDYDVYVQCLRPDLTEVTWQRRSGLHRFQ